MILETLFALSQIVATVVVVATLMAILVQMNQTNRIAKAELTLQAWLQTGALQLSLANSPEKAEFLRRVTSGAELSEDESLRAVYVIAVALGTHEAGFNLRKRGLVEDGAYIRLEESTRLYMNSPGWRALWRRRRSSYDPEFRDLVDAIAAEIETRQASPPTT